MISKSSMIKFMKLALNTIAAGIIFQSLIGLAQAGATAEKNQINNEQVAKKLKPGTYVPPANVLIPESSKEYPGDVGVRGHTNILIRKPDGDSPQPSSDLGVPAPASKGK